LRALIGAPPSDQAGGHRRDLLIEHLHAINDHCNGLPPDLLVALAADMRLGVAEVFEVASFYHHFQVLPEGQTQGPALTVRVCDGLSCQLAGAAPLLADLQARLPGLLGCTDGVGEGRVKVEAAPCVGRCEQAPAVQVGQAPLGRADVAGVIALAGEVLTDFDPKWPLPLDFNGLSAISSVGLASYQAQGGYQLLAQVQRGERSAESLITTLEHAGLRGLGGAGFPAGRKWRIVRGQPAPKLMVVNIDEGEPGTFKDRWYLERDPHRFLEGMLIAASAVGCETIYIYLRDEYHVPRRILQTALDELQQAVAGGATRQVATLAHDDQGHPAVLQGEHGGIAASPVTGLPALTLPRIELRRGAGAYICGEESAMIESIEGKRGEPRLRPPYIAQTGLFGRPTLEHNFETLYWVREIVERGPEWFASHGRHDRRGLRSFSVSGRVQSPGVKLAPAGITLRELIDEHCGGMAQGHTLYAYLPGGASGGILPAALADVPLDFDTLQAHGCFIGSAAVVVLSQADSARDAALNAMQFFAHESCGQCTPCRVGTAKAAVLMQAPVWDEATLQDLGQVMTDASICGLGQAAPNPMQCVLKYFPHEVGVSTSAQTNVTGDNA
jgi:formate dehydrogenase